MSAVERLDAALDERLLVLGVLVLGVLGDVAVLLGVVDALRDLRALDVDELVELGAQPLEAFGERYSGLLFTVVLVEPRIEHGHTACPRASMWGPETTDVADRWRAGDAAVLGARDCTPTSVRSPRRLAGRGRATGSGLSDLPDVRSSIARRTASGATRPLRLTCLAWSRAVFGRFSCAVGAWQERGPDSLREGHPHRSGAELASHDAALRPRASASSRPPGRAPSGCSRSRPTATASRVPRTRSVWRMRPATISGVSASRPFTSMTPATRTLSPPCSAQRSVSHIERFANSRLSARVAQVAEVRARTRRTTDTRSRVGRGSCRSTGAATSPRRRPRCTRWRCRPSRAGRRA